MKKVTLFLAIAGLGLGLGCLERPLGKANAGTGLLYRHQFAGTAALAKNPNGTKLKEILALPETKGLQDYALPMLAKAPREFWLKKLPANAPDVSALARPLLDDLLAAESWMEIRGPNQRLESVLAIQLNDERACLWNTNLWQWLRAWQLGTPAAAQVDGFAGWELKKHDSPNLIQCVRAGQWLLVGAGTDRLTLLPAMLQQVRKAGRPTAALAGDKLLELEADLPRLANWFPVFAKNPLPPTLLTVFGRGENLRTEAKFRFSAPLPWKFEPWRLATNMIQDPIVSFTIGQGIAPLLSQIKGMPELGLKQMPNQFCTWAQAGTPWQTFITMPVANGSNFIQKLAPAVPKIVHEQLGNTTGEILWASNRAELRWQGLPFVTPSLRAVHTNSGDFLFFSMFPRAPRTNPPPAELFAQIAGRNNLVYYDWEITQERLHELRQLGTLLSIAKSWPEAPSTSPTRVWLTKVGPMLGNTITEVTQTAPNELALVRKSHIGLTGFELLTLTRWLESPAFPWRFEPPPKLRPPGWTNRAGKAFTNKTARPAGPILAIPQGPLPMPPRTNSPASKPR